jgi:non-heme chloroperoxidase
VTRYLGTYGSDRVSRAVLISPIPPFFLATDEDPPGAPLPMFEGFLATARDDRPAWLKGFLENFYNMDVYGGSRVSAAAFDASLAIAASASPIAAVKCIPTWMTDFRADVASFDVPVLVIQGDQDRVLPIELTGNRLPDLIKGLELTVVEGGPHAIAWTHADEVNAALGAFLS